MTRIIQSFSVPDGSIAHAKLNQWKEEGANISANIQMLLEEGGHSMDHVNALKRKIQRLAKLTNNRALTKEEWEEEFMFWGE